MTQIHFSGDILDFCLCRYLIFWSLRSSMYRLSTAFFGKPSFLFSHSSFIQIFPIRVPVIRIQSHNSAADSPGLLHVVLTRARASASAICNSNNIIQHNNNNDSPVAAPNGFREKSYKSSKTALCVWVYVYMCILIYSGKTRKSLDRGRYEHNNNIIIIVFYYYRCNYYYHRKCCEWVAAAAEAVKGAAWSAYKTRRLPTRGSQPTRLRSWVFLLLLSLSVNASRPREDFHRSTSVNHIVRQTRFKIVLGPRPT